MIRASLAALFLASAVPTNAGCREHVSAAAEWSGLPSAWIAAVMQAESSGRPSARSSAGAIGCMQLMPGTWVQITSRYSLGADPYHVRANMFAGAAYLRALVDRFGWPTALAGYHAGPGRAQAFLAGRPLPAETSIYIARVVALTSPRQAEPSGKSYPADQSPHPLFAVWIGSADGQPGSK